MATLIVQIVLFTICLLGFAIFLFAAARSKSDENAIVWFWLAIIVFVLGCVSVSFLVQAARDYDQQTSGRKGESK